MSEHSKKKIVFLGTPEVAARTLEIFIQGIATDPQKKEQFEIAMVVSQPQKRRSRKGEAVPTPVHQCALNHQIPVLTPENAKDPVFLQQLAELQPDLCITAAYGCYLPKKFLEIPKAGTVNIHPSLLPRYRGAAPVQRCLENGDSISGVTLLMTVNQMDAGPIIAQESFPVGEALQAGEMLNILFERGARLLLGYLDPIISKTAFLAPQKEADATLAAKIQPHEARLDLKNLTASQLHNKVRAFSLWPCAKIDLECGGNVITDVKILQSAVLNSDLLLAPTVSKFDTTIWEGTLVFGCHDGSFFQVLELQCPGKKPLKTKDFINGFPKNSRNISFKI